MELSNSINFIQEFGSYVFISYGHLTYNIYVGGL